MRANVAVNIIYDAYGSQDTPASLFDALRHAGANVVTFNPIDPISALTGHSPNDRDHRKIMVVDGRIGFTGGINLARTYENPPYAGVPPDGDTAHAYWRDTAVRIEGPAVADLQRLFFDTWNKQKGPAVQSRDYFPLWRAKVCKPSASSAVRPETNDRYITSLWKPPCAAARQRIWLSTGYFVPPHQEREDLGKAARRGVDVRIVVPSHSDVDAAVYAGRAAYGDLLESGSQSIEMQTAVLHSKLATVDGVWTAIGSSNLDRRSVVFNNEVDAIILGADTAPQVEALLRSATSRSRGRSCCRHGNIARSTNA